MQTITQNKFYYFKLFFFTLLFFFTGLVNALSLSNTIIKNLTITKVKSYSLHLENVYEPITNNTITLLSSPIVCDNSENGVSIEGTVPEGGTTSFTYKWEISTDNITFTTIQGATTQRYAPNPFSTTTYFRRIAISGPLTSASNVVKIIVKQLIEQPILGSVIQPTCNNSLGFFSILNYEPLYTYDIQPNIGVVQNEETIMAPEGYYTVKAKLGNCTSAISVTLKVNAQPLAPSIPILSDIIHPTCSNSIGSFAILNYNSAYIYEINPAVGTTITGNQVTASSGNYAIIAKSAHCESIELAVINAQPETPPIPALSIKTLPTCTNLYPSFTITNYNPLYTYQKTSNSRTITLNSDTFTESAGSYFYITATLGRCSTKAGRLVDIISDYRLQQPILTTVKPTCDSPTGKIIITNYNEEYSYEVNPPLGVTISGNVITALPGTYYVTVRSGASCLSDQEKAKIEEQSPKPAKISITEKICSGEKYTWTANNTEYTKSGTYIVKNDECTANQELNLTVTSKPDDIITSEIICEGQTYTWPANGISYTTAQNGLKIVNYGCTADEILNLEVTPKINTVWPKEICSGETYDWPANGLSYNESGVYYLQGNECRGNQILILTVKAKPETVSITETICSGEKYTWTANNTEYTESGTYIVKNDGCTADQELVLIVTPKPNIVSVTETICSGENYIWAVNNVKYTASGTYIVNNDGCTADQELVLIVTPKPKMVSVTLTVCEGESSIHHAANKTKHTTTRTYIKENDGCTADEMVVEIVTPKPEMVSVTETICEGENYIWAVNNTKYTAAGTYIVKNDGCTADQELVLIVTPKPNIVSVTETICLGETYTWAVNNTKYTTAGTYIVKNDGCTADYELVLIVTPKPDIVSVTETICSGENYIWAVNNVKYTASGTYIVNNDGCTADQELVLIVTPKPKMVSVTLTVCEGESSIHHAANKTKHTTTRTYIKENDGCTADEMVVEIITPKPEMVSVTETICEGENYIWAVNNTKYTASGTYIVNNDGCTADQELVLIVTPKPASPTITKTPATCTTAESSTISNYNPGNTYTFNPAGPSVGTAGLISGMTIGTSYYVTAAKGICTSQKSISFNNADKLQDLIVTQIAFQTCVGTVYKDFIINKITTGKVTGIGTPINLPSGLIATWSPSDNTIKINGTLTVASKLWYSIPLITDDCGIHDAIGEIVVKAKPADDTASKTICSGESYTWADNGIVYTTSGIYRITNDRCTADKVLQLTVEPKPADDTASKTICSGESYTWADNGIVYTTSGTYRITNDGCTADKVLQLTVAPKPADQTLPETICSGKSYTWADNGTVYTTSGIYRITNDGCTADKVLQLTVTPKPADQTLPETICSGKSYTWADNGTVYTTSGIYRITNDGCTADKVLQLTVAPKPADDTASKTICSGESYKWADNGTVYTTSGTYRITNDGCTADKVLQLTVAPKPADQTLPETICSGESYTWADNGTVYTTSGIYRITNDGCTADKVLQLTVTSKPADDTASKTICSGESYTWADNGTVYTTSGIYRITNDGCTADKVLQLTVNPKPADQTLPETICSGESYTWADNGIVYTTSGIYRITNDGCTADKVLQLTVEPKPADQTLPETICSGESYTWADNGTVYTTSGIYRITNDGCTADKVLQLTVVPKPADQTLPETICSGESYTWADNGIVYTTSGTYRITNDGCTADNVLQLTVAPKPADDTASKTICSGESYTWADNGTVYTTSGIYRITNDRCTADKVLQLTVNPILSSSLVPDSLSPELCAGEKDGSFKIEITGGTMPYSANLDHKNSTYTAITSNEYTFTELSGGSHTAYIKDALGCTTEVEVSLPKAVTINPVANISYPCPDEALVNSVIITVDSSITDPEDLDYSLDGIVYQSENTFINVSSGQHTIKVRHTNGCIQSTREFFIDFIQPLEVTLADGGLNEIVAAATGGIGQYRYSINNESFGTTNKFIIYKSGLYTVTVTDQNGCTATTSKYYEHIDVCILNNFTPNGDGINDEWGPGCSTQYRNLTFTIFDRYGRIIQNYKYGQKWDGKYNGAELTSGDYWYVLKLNDPKDNREFVGHFTLYR